MNVTLKSLLYPPTGMWWTAPVKNSGRPSCCCAPLDSCYMVLQLQSVEDTHVQSCHFYLGFNDEYRSSAVHRLYRGICCSSLKRWGFASSFAFVFSCISADVERRLLFRRILQQVPVTLSGGISSSAQSDQWALTNEGPKSKERLTGC